MIKKRLPQSRYLVRKGSLLLPLSGIVFCCAYNMFHRSTPPIQYPVILAFASLLLFIPAQSLPWIAFTKFIGFYLLSIPVSQITNHSFSMTLFEKTWSVSYSLTVFLLLLLTNGFQQRKTTHKPPDLFSSWTLLAVVLATQLGVLRFLLHSYYGYGYQADLTILGHLSLFFLLFLILRSTLNNPEICRLLGLVLFLYYALLAFPENFIL